MTMLNMLMYGFIGYTVVYMILKAIEQNEKYKKIQKPVQKPTQKQVEIKSRNLYCKAENLIAKHEVYALQVEQIVTQINDVEDALNAERQSCIRSDKEIKSLIAKSLKLQEQKHNIESKMLKIMDDLDKIAMEEYKRQMMTL